VAGVASDFLPGLELARLFYTEVVAPAVATLLPGMPYSAALLGWGSEVQGFDTVRSTDHAWGPRLQVFLGGEDFRAHADELDAGLDRELPVQFRGYPVRFSFPDGAPARHWVHVSDLRAFLTGQLRSYRNSLAWYPGDVWRYVLACQWLRLSQEEPFVGRCGEVGDDLGSAVVAARQVRDLMRLCLLMNRVYPPYSKWLGTAFAALPCAQALTPLLSGALSARTWQDRERHLSPAYEFVAELHNGLGLTERVDPKVRHFHGRPFLVLDAYRVTDALRATITDPVLSSLPPVGAIDQYVDSTDLTSFSDRRRRYLAGP
jgi:hypothetical protein